MSAPCAPLCVSVALLSPYITPAFQWLNMLFMDPDRSDSLTRAMVGLLGDLSETFPNGQLREFLVQEWVDKLVRQARTDRHSSGSTKEVAKWARVAIKLQINGGTG